MLMLIMNIYFCMTINPYTIINEKKCSTLTVIECNDHQVHIIYNRTSKRIGKLTIWICVFCSRFCFSGGLQMWFFVRTNQMSFKKSKRGKLQKQNERIILKRERDRSLIRYAVCCLFFFFCERGERQIRWFFSLTIERNGLPGNT